MVRAMGNKGDRGERELVNLLRDLDFKIMRAPSSGSATTRDLPDVLAGNGEGILIACEGKFWADGTHYFSEEEVAALKRFAFGFHPQCKPLLATRWNRDKTWYVRHADDARLHVTDGGNVRAKKETCTEEWRTLEDFLALGEEIRGD